MSKIINKIKNFILNFYPIYFCSRENKRTFKDFVRFIEDGSDFYIRSIQKKNLHRRDDMNFILNSDDIFQYHSIYNKIGNDLRRFSMLNDNDLHYIIQKNKFITNNIVSEGLKRCTIEFSMIHAIDNDLQKLMDIKKKYAKKPIGQKFIPVIDPYGEENWEE